jgi:hypothetical protein
MFFHGGYLVLSLSVSSYTWSGEDGPLRARRVSAGLRPASLTLRARNGHQQPDDESFPKQSSPHTPRAQIPIYEITWTYSNLPEIPKKEAKGAARSAFFRS